MTLFFIGANSRLAQSVLSNLKSENYVRIERKIYHDWWKPCGKKKAYEYFQKQQTLNSSIMIFSALLDPSFPRNELFKINYQLPKNIIDGVANLNIKVITFGTIMENFLNSQNSYVQSKIKLGNYINYLSRNFQKVLHIRLHTLYGEHLPSSHMFLGQILKSLKNNYVFKMTSGEQFREYHHLNDDAKAILMISSKSNFGIFDLNHGNAVKLKNIAIAIFQNFNKSHLLQIGKLTNPGDEVYNLDKINKNIYDKIVFRPTIPSIIEYMNNCQQILDKKDD